MFSLDDDRFATNERDAVELVKHMAALYEDEEQTSRLVTTWIEEFHILRGKISSYDRWEDLAKKLAKRNKLRVCVQAAYEQYKGNSSAKFLETLLKRKFDFGDDEGAAAFDPWEFLGLFDRSTERDLLHLGLLPLAKPPFPPIVIGILAERADEHDFFVRRANAELLRRFLGSTGASQDSDLLDWSDWRVSAETEIRKIAQKKSVNGFRREGDALEQLDKIIARLGRALGSRTATLELSTKDLAQEAMRAKLKEFMGYWRSFEAQRQPPVLYVIAVRYDDADPSPEELEPKLAELFAEAGCKALTPLTLCECEPKHFPPWRGAITALGRKINDKRYDQFTQSFKATFRLRELKDRLHQPEGRIYS